MKKFFIFLLITMIIAPTAMFASEHIVVKDDGKITVFTIGNYGEKNMYIDTYSLINPTLAEMSGSIPKEAWGMCASSRDGIYSSILSETNQRYEELEVRYNLLEQDYNQVDNSRRKVLIILVMALCILVVISARFIYYHQQYRKMMK
jgi:hypothetical protein